MPEKPKKSKRFRYNLETVLKVRAIRERQEQEKYHLALEKVKEEKDKEAALIHQEAEEYRELREILTGELGRLQTILSRKARLEKLKEDIVAQTKKREEAEEAAEVQRLALIEAVKQKKIMLKDKEKKRTAWKKFMDKEDAKFLDDIATIGFEHKTRARLEDEMRSLE
jgi:flagellar biosynthesis chaperone FliJ